MNISVYITSYNQKSYLIEAIDSVLAQTLAPRQVIIVDDHSSDGSQEVIAQYARRYPDLITPIYHGSNQGVARTRNDALNAVEGDYVTNLGGDDRFLPTKLEKEAGLLATSPGAQMAFSNYYFISADGDQTGLWADGVTAPEGDIFAHVFSRDFPRRMDSRAELVEMAAYARCGLHDPSLRILEDRDILIRLTKHSRAVYCGEPLSEYRRHPAGLSQGPVSEKLALLERIASKNLHLLDDLDPGTRRSTLRLMNDYHALVARLAAEEQLDQGAGSIASRVRALGYLTKCVSLNPGRMRATVAARAVLPEGLYRSLVHLAWRASRRLHARRLAQRD